MGIKVDMSQIKRKLPPRRRFRAGVQAVISIVRMRKVANEWREMCKLGEALRKAKLALDKRRASRLVEQR